VRARDGHERETNSSPNQGHGVAEIPGLAITHHDKRNRNRRHWGIDQMKVTDNELEDLLTVLAAKHGTTVATLRAEARTKYCATFADKYALPWSLARRLTQYVCA
jgi:hypothetical protein